MNNKRRCPVCLNAEDGQFNVFPTWFECDICGSYTMDLDPFLDLQIQKGHNHSGYWDLNPVQRAVLSHRIRTKSGCAPKAESELFRVTLDVLDSIRSDGKLPSLAMQAENLIRFIGDEVSRSGEGIPRLPNCIHAIIGALNRKVAIQLANELRESGILRFTPFGSNAIPEAITLSFDGQKLYDDIDKQAVPEDKPPIGFRHPR